MSESAAWSVFVSAADAVRGRELELEADEAARARLAQLFELAAVERFIARVRTEAWLDGVRLRGDWSARVVYTCGLTLDPFAADLAGALDLKLLPEGSRNAPSPDAEPLGDPDADDPPEVFEGERIDVGDLLAQHLSVELDPFPRKPGASFEPPPADLEPSPFAALAALKPKP